MRLDIRVLAFGFETLCVSGLFWPPGFLDSFSNGREALEFRLGPLNERELFLREEISKVLGSFLPEVVKPNMDNVKPRMALVCYDLFKDTCTNISFNKKP